MATQSPAPIFVRDVETKVADAAPEAVRPEVKAVEAAFNDLVESAASKAPEVEGEAEKDEPAVADTAKDAATAATGGTVPVATLVSDAGRAVKEVKAGYKTTEFWLTVVVIVLSQVGALSLPGKYGETITTAAAAFAYVISRGLAK